LSLSPILFLFYNLELLDICQHLKKGLLAIGFADNINILVYSKLTESNCQILEIGYTRCLDWARYHRIKFVPNKYKLIYFTKSRQFNL